ncbi:MAG: deoxynucleoside kinase [Trueperaceae bacterium]|nr:deoxynucleoside kinase [Trueperaceae bacterium]
MYVAIAGNIGVGKSSLTRILSDRYALEPIFEAVDDNPYLPDFYRDMKRWAFHSQMFFLAERLRQHLRQVNPGERVIQDRTVYEDAAVFARNLWQEGILSGRDHDAYRRMYEAIAATLRPPDLLVYLRASVSTLKERIDLRGRAYESDIAESYLARLNELYDAFVASYDLSRTVVLPADELDFVRSDRDRRRTFELLEPHGLVPPLVRS